MLDAQLLVPYREEQETEDRPSSVLRPQRCFHMLREAQATHPRQLGKETAENQILSEWVSSECRSGAQGESWRVGRIWKQGRGRREPLGAGPAGIALKTWRWGSKAPLLALDRGREKARSSQSVGADHSLTSTGAVNHLALTLARTMLKDTSLRVLQMPCLWERLHQSN